MPDVVISDGNEILLASSLTVTSVLLEDETSHNGFVGPAIDRVGQLRDMVGRPSR